MLVGLVGAGDGVAHGRDVVVGPDRNRQPDRPGESDRCAGGLLDDVGCGELELVARLGAADLAFVGFVIAADQHGHRLAVGQVDRAS